MNADDWRADDRLKASLRRYARAGRNRIRGWFLRSDAEIFASILFDQARRRVDGAALEIGVHHGRSFVPLSLSASASDPAIAIDIFDRQDLNTVDPSGRGDYARFQRNIRQHGDWSRTRPIASSSLDLQPRDLGAKLRFASVDGAHWHDAVVSDLKLVEGAAGDDCVIALDDMFNPVFPEVMSGFFTWWASRPNFIPLATSNGKAYLCRPAQQEHYQKVLLANGHLHFNHVKTIDFLGSQILVLAGFGGRLRPTLARTLYVYSPGLHARLKRLLKRTPPNNVVKLPTKARAEAA